MNTKRIATIFVISQLLATVIWAAEAPPVIPVWPGVPPGSEGKVTEEKVRITADDGEHVLTAIHRPTLTVYLPAADRATGAAVVICPGGGHRELWIDHEGYAVARWLAEHGVAGFVLKYRLAQETGSTYTVDGEEVADLQRAVQLVRSRAAEWSVDPARVGVIGFSAGGELAALGSMHFLPAKPDAVDAVERQESRPAFQALIYPGNADRIIPTKESPTAFLLCGYDDNPVISEGVAKAYLRFHQVGVPAELHIYSGVGHGFGLRERNHGAFASWPDRLLDWLGASGFLGKSP